MPLAEEKNGERRERWDGVTVQNPSTINRNKFGNTNSKI
jgi:hypothetical protein